MVLTASTSCLVESTYIDLAGSEESMGSSISVVLKVKDGSFVDALCLINDACSFLNNHLLDCGWVVDGHCGDQVNSSAGWQPVKEKVF